MIRSRILLGSILSLTLLSSIMLVTLAETGQGVLSLVWLCDTAPPSLVPKDDQGKFVVVPGHYYCVLISDVEFSQGTVLSVWIKGHSTDGTPWIIELKDQVVDDGGDILTSCFQIPPDSGCTITVAYYHQGHLAAESPGSNNPGHMKTYGDDDPPFDNPVPCEGVTVPEFPLGPEAIAAVGLVAWMAVRRRRKL